MSKDKQVVKEVTEEEIRWQSKMKPMRAAKVDLTKLVYPVIGSPKLDGIRCLMKDGVAMSKSMKPIPNEYVQSQLINLHALDGELMVEGDYNSVQSAIMSVAGKPKFTFHVFDHCNYFRIPHMQSYEERLVDLQWNPLVDGRRVRLLEHVWLGSEAEVEAYLDSCIAKGYEGIMLRSPQGPYKFGTSTVNEGYLLKYKRFHDDEGTLISVTEKMINGNELKKDELGYAKRSSAKAGLIPGDTAGGCVVKWNGLNCPLGFGPGLDNKFKQDLWDFRETYEGQLVKFSYQDLSKDGVPRFGKLLGFRHKDDM